MKAVLLALLLFTLPFVYGSEDEVLEEEEVASPIIELTIEDFDSVTKSNPFVVVEFYAPWCGACKRFAPDYEELAQELAGIALFTKFDAWNEAHKAISDKYNIAGYPTLWFFINGEAQEFTGNIFTEDLAQIIIRKSRPTEVKVSNLEEIHRKITEDRIVVLGLFDSEDSEEYKSFAETAKKLHDSFLFIAQVGEYSETKSSYNIEKTPVALIFINGENKPIFVDNFSTLEHSIRWNEFPLLDEIGRHNGKLYVDSKIPILFFFFENSEHKETYAPMLKNIAKETRLKLNLVFISWENYQNQASKLGLSGKVVPSIAIENTTSKLHFVFDETKEITEEALSAWVSDFLEGKLDPTLRSQELPESNDEPVKIVVGKNFNEVVLDATKDVFLEYYAPWCGHCKKLAPIWDDLGLTFKDHPSIVIAKMDATANDIQPPHNKEIGMFPTMKYFKANDKLNPVEYPKKERTLEAFIDFIKEHSSTPIDVESLPKIVKDEL